MDNIVATIYAACLSAEAEPHAELVNSVISAIQDGLAGPDKDQALSIVLTKTEELATERKQTGALFRIKLAAIASAAKSLPPVTRDALIASLQAMTDVARQHTLVEISEAIDLITNSIKKSVANVARSTSDPTMPTVQSVLAAKPQSIPNQTLLEYLKRNGRCVASDKIYFAPDIPLKKISGAMHSIGGKVNESDIIILIDDTAFGGAKEGVYITNECIFVKEVMTRLALYHFDAITHIGTDGNAIFINHRKIVGLTMPNKRDLALLFSAVNDYLALTKANQPVSPSEASSAPDPAPQQSERSEADGCEDLNGFHGFFYTKAAEITFDNKMPHVVRTFLVDIANASMGLFQFLKGEGCAISQRSQWIATSDLVHFESIIYAVGLTIHLMDTKVSMDKHLKSGLYDVMLFNLVVAYIETFADELEINQEVKARLGTYGDLMRSNPGGLPNAIYECLLQPCVSYTFGETLLRRVAGALSTLRSEALSADMGYMYARALSERVESALIRYVEQLG